MWAQIFVVAALAIAGTPRVARGAETPGGRILDRDGRELPPAELVERLIEAPLILVGERHDHPAHHAIQAWLIGEFAQRPGEAPRTLVLEIFTTSETAGLERHREEHPRDAEGLATQFGWGRTGSALAAYYVPVLAAALEAGLPIRGGDLPAAAMAALRSAESEAVPGPVRARLSRTLPAQAEQALRDELRRSHCGHAPEALLEQFVAAQRARDAQLAEALAAAGRDGHAILIAGNGHVRDDRGAPFYLTPAERRASATLGLLEREVGKARLEGGEGLPFDFVWLTEDLPEEDPCERFRERLERLSDERQAHH